MAWRTFVRSFIFLQIASAHMAIGSANAQPVLQVYWGYENPKIDGSVDRVMAPPHILNAVRGCGFQPRFTVGPSFVPVSLVHCPGILNFSRSSRFKAQLNARLSSISATHGFRDQLSQVSIAISEHLVFVSTADGLGDARKMAINIPSKKMVILNQVMWEKLDTISSQNDVLLHEILMALGYNDSQYQISSALMVGIGSSLDKARPRKKMAGAYIAGHGGDTTGAYFKASLLKTITEGTFTLRTDVVIPSRFVPTKAQMIEVIRRTPVTLNSLENLRKLNVCTSVGLGSDGDEFCGGFVLKGLTGTPFMIIPNEFGTFVPTERNHSLIKKVYVQLYFALARKAGFQK